jgi:hypothetical protein
MSERRRKDGRAPEANKVNNTARKINARIDDLLPHIRPGSAKNFIDLVYRPFCHSMSDAAKRGEPVEQVVDAGICLLANLTSELCRATSDRPGPWAKVILAQVEKMVEDQGKERKLQ